MAAVNSEQHTKRKLKTAREWFFELLDRLTERESVGSKQRKRERKRNEREREKVNEGDIGPIKCHYKHV